MSLNKILSLTFLAVILAGSSAALAGALLTRGGSSGGVTWVKTPEQTKAETPAEFAEAEIEQFVLPEGENLAKGKKVIASGFTDVYNAKQAVDERDKTYWEGDALPSFFTVDMGEEYAVSKVVLQLPPLRVWGKRTQVVKISVSADGENFTEVSPEAPYIFDAQTGNAVLIEFAQTNTRFVRADISSNTGAKGGQLSEFRIFE